MENLTGMTMQEIRALIDANIEAINATEVMSDKISLKAKIKDEIQAYNTASMLTVYANCIADENPLIAFTKAYYYNVISFKEAVVDDIDADGKKISHVVYSIKEVDNKGYKLVKNLDLVKFIEWTEDRNKQVTADKCWKAAYLKARNEIVEKCKKHIKSKDGEKISKSAIKKDLQAMFDALIFIPCKNTKDKNAVIVNGDIAGVITSLAAKMKEEPDNGKPTFKVEYFSDSEWRKLAFQLLYMAVENKTFEIVYDMNEEGTEAEPEAEKAEVEDNK